MNRAIKFTVIGAGNGGKAMAADLAVKGFPVVLYNRSLGRIAGVRQAGGIQLTDDARPRPVFAPLTCVTTDLAQAVAGAHVIMIVVPANAHRDLALRLAPLLEDGQIIVLNPGRTFGALEFRQVLAQAGCPADVVVAEAQTFIFASRADGPAQAHIFRTKEWVALAAYPAQDTSRVLAALNPAYPQFRHGRSILHTGLNNIGAIFHPAILLLNTGWIEATQGGFEFYFDGVTPTVARIMEAVDRERLSLGAHLGVQLISARDWLFQAYHAQGEDLYTAILDQEGYRGIFAPGTMDHRYLHEDIPMSLVPLASLGQHLGVPVNAMQSLIHLANLAHHTDYEQIGRTVASLGLQSLSGPHIRARLEGLPTPSYKLNDPPRPKLPQETGLAENGHQPVHRVQTPLLD